MARSTKPLDTAPCSSNSRNTGFTLLRGKGHTGEVVSLGESVLFHQSVGASRRGGINIVCRNVNQDGLRAAGLGDPCGTLDTGLARLVME